MRALKEVYVTPRIEKILMDDSDVILTSSGIAKNPGNHPNCTVMPNGKPLPDATMNRC